MARHNPFCKPVAVMAGVLAVLVLGASPGEVAGQRGMTKDIGGVPEKKEFREIEVVLPAYPAQPDLLQFLPRRNSKNRYFIDRKSVSIGGDQVVRYSVVIKSSSDVENTSYEGIRCETSEFKTYAYGSKGSEWSKARNPQWRKIENSSADHRFTLSRDYFCDGEVVAGRRNTDLVANIRGNPLDNYKERVR